MAFELKSVVPWGRSFDEYVKMFSFSDEDLARKIIGFGDGPASFNYEMSQKKKTVISCDPVYQFSKDELYQRLQETKDEVLQQTKNNINNFVWTHIANISELEKIRMSAMKLFLNDYETGLKEKRYVPYSLPDVPFEDNSFDIGISSHFLLLYGQLGEEFHLQAINEMLRICKEVRIFPIIDLDLNRPYFFEKIIAQYESEGHLVATMKVDYEFQKGGNQMLKIIKK